MQQSEWTVKPVSMHLVNYPKRFLAIAFLESWNLLIFRSLHSMISLVSKETYSNFGCWLLFQRGLQFCETFLCIWEMNLFFWNNVCKRSIAINLQLGVRTTSPCLEQAMFIISYILSKFRNTYLIVSQISKAPKVTWSYIEVLNYLFFYFIFKTVDYR